MITQGEYIFTSFEEALTFVNKPTNYEQEKGIKILRSRPVLNTETLKVIMIEKSDNTETMFLFFKNSTKYDIWKFWCPSETQAKLLGSVSSLYEYVDLKNSKNRVIADGLHG